MEPQNFFLNGITGPGEVFRAVSDIISICRIAWKEKLMSGWSGNASIRCAADQIVITAGGVAKGNLRPADCLLLDRSGRQIGGQAKPSSESAMHLAVYETLPQCCAVLHTHPLHMQTLGLLLDKFSGSDFADRFLNLDLFESETWRARLDIAEAQKPGTSELAEGVRKCLERECPLPRGVWLRNHGLCAIGADLASCLALTEELEYLGEIQLRCMSALAD